MEKTVRDYITACNADDVEGVAATCTPDAVHYFPAHMHGDDEPVRVGRAIWGRNGHRWFSRSAHTGRMTFGKSASR
jgi:hypothetical protein